MTVQIWVEDHDYAEKGVERWNGGAEDDVMFPGNAAVGWLAGWAGLEPSWGRSQKSGKDRDEVTFLGFVRIRREVEFWTEIGEEQHRSVGVKQEGVRKNTHIWLMLDVKECLRRGSEVQVPPK